jgi:hypothetical protein
MVRGVSSGWLWRKGSSNELIPHSKNPINYVMDLLF